MDYLEGNTALAKDILTLFDLVKLIIELILKASMTALNNTLCYNNNDDDGSLALTLLQALTAAEMI